MYKANKLNLKLSAISLGVVSLFSASAARADDDEVRALTQPQSTVQVEMIGVDQNSAKFGEYNGLYGHPSGAYPNAALNIRGGGAYTNNEQGNTSRWSVTGDNLGLTSRSANVSIADQGKGIPVEVRHKIFAPNFTTKSSGTGLGLAICRGIAEKANGNIWFSTTDKGTVFYVEFPLDV